MKTTTVKKSYAHIAALLVAGLVVAPAIAQYPTAPAAGQRAGVATPIMIERSTEVRGSLFEQGADAAVPAPAENDEPVSTSMSFTAVQTPIPHKFRKNDIVTVVVQEDSGYSSSGEGKSEKKQDYDMAIQQFIQLATSASGVPAVGVVGQPSKLPEIKFKYDNNRDNKASQDRTDSFTVRIAATVVDVKPNGNCVIQAVKQITMDKEIQSFRLSGTCCAADVTPDNTILSTQLADLTVSKTTNGEVRDGLRRGWLNKIIDKFNPL